MISQSIIHHHHKTPCLQWKFFIDSVEVFLPAGVLFDIDCPDANDQSHLAVRVGGFEQAVAEQGIPAERLLVADPYFGRGHVGRKRGLRIQRHRRGRGIFCDMLGGVQPLVHQTPHFGDRVVVVVAGREFQGPPAFGLLEDHGVGTFRAGSVRDSARVSDQPGPGDDILRPALFPVREDRPWRVAAMGRQPVRMAGPGPPRTVEPERCEDYPAPVLHHCVDHCFPQAGRHPKRPWHAGCIFWCRGVLVRLREGKGTPGPRQARRRLAQVTLHTGDHKVWVYVNVYTNERRN